MCWCVHLQIYIDLYLNKAALCLFVLLYLCVCFFLCLCVCICVFLCNSLSIFPLFFFTFLYFPLFVCNCLFGSVCLCVCVCLCERSCVQVDHYMSLLVTFSLPLAFFSYHSFSLFYSFVFVSMCVGDCLCMF